MYPSSIFSGFALWRYRIPILPISYTYDHSFAHSNW